jgi:hypothetical protein
MDVVPAAARKRRYEVFTNRSRQDHRRRWSYPELIELAGCIARTMKGRTKLSWLFLEHLLEIRQRARILGLTEPEECLFANRQI